MLAYDHRARILCSYEHFTKRLKNAIDNIYLKPGMKCSAKVFASDPNNDPLTFKWVILKEVIERSQGGAREIEPDNVPFYVKK
jgi:hypothetical protein